jgi:5-methylphenazine-1-carboxylate 1-monooxygenase
MTVLIAGGGIGGLTLNELEEIAANYKSVAGFQVEGLNAKPPIVTMPAQGKVSSAG